MSVNDINFSSNFPQWAKPEQLDVTFVDMSDAVLSYPIKVPASVPHEFSLSWWISVKGEKFYNTTLKPEGYKDDKSDMYNYTLTLESERKDLKRYIWVDIDAMSGVPLIKSYANIFKLNLADFADKLNANLKFYGLYDRWEVRIDPSLPIDVEKKLVNAENAFLWDILQQTTEIYGEMARWVIEVQGNKLIILMGKPASEINHIFKYGGDTPDGDGGLVKIQRTLSAERLATVLTGRGGERNIPERYFEPAGDNFPADPDTNKYTASLNLHNLMPKCFRDYNRGWNSKIANPSESKAYNQGVSDTSYHPVEWVQSELGVATYGEIWDNLEPKEDIYPTIQGMTADEARAAGVVTTAVGRIDEVVAVEVVENDDFNAVATSTTTEIAKSTHIANITLGSSSPLPFVDSELFQVTSDKNSLSCKHLLSVMRKGGGEVVSTESFSDKMIISIVDAATGQEYRAIQSSLFINNIPKASYVLRYAVSTPSNDEYTYIGRVSDITIINYVIESVTDTNAYKPTFNIWVKDIGFDLRKPEFWAKENMTVLFSSGWLSQSDDYEFEVMGKRGESGAYTEVGVYPDTTKANIRGEKSAWRIALVKSDAELDTTGKMLPNAAINAVEGDTFFFININMPHSYVLYAEKRQEDYLKLALAKIDHEVPIYSITPDRIFCNTFEEVERLKVGSKIRVANSKLIEGVYETLHIQSITLKYNFKDRVLPDWEMVVTDKISATINPIQRVSAELASLSHTALTEANVAAQLSAIGDKRWLRKDGVADVSDSETSFSRTIKSTNFKAGGFAGAGWGMYKDANNSSVLELDRLVVRKDLSVSVLNINQIDFTLGETVFSNGGCQITAVAETGDYWKCYYDTAKRTRFAGLKSGDLVRAQRYDAQSSSIIKYYWALVEFVGLDFVHISKTEKDGAGVPAAGDKIVQFGNKTDKTRQGAVVIDPRNGASIQVFSRIDSFSLVDKSFVGMGVDGATGQAYGYNYGQQYIGDRDRNNFIEFIDGKVKIKAIVDFTAGSTGLENLQEWGDNFTSITGGLILSSMIELGHKVGDVFKVNAGMSGLGNLAADILGWYGGERSEDRTNANRAKIVFRRDGSGYLADGNLWWDANGDISSNFKTIYIGQQDVKDALLNKLDKTVWDKEFAVTANGLTHKRTAIFSDAIIMSNATGGGGGTTDYNSLDNLPFIGGVKVSGSKSLADYGLWGFGLATQSWVNNRIPNVSAWALQATKPSYSWTEIDSKPTTLSGFGITDGVINSDIRLTNARPASDVYAWAKAATKPSYGWSEISGKPTTFAPSAHNQAITTITGLQGALDSKLVKSAWDIEFNATSTGLVHKRTAIFSDAIIMSGYEGGGGGILPAGSLDEVLYFDGKNWIGKHKDTFGFLTQSALNGYATQAWVTARIPSVSAWALQTTKPSYSAAEVGALPISGGTVTGRTTVNDYLLAGQLEWKMEMGSSTVTDESWVGCTNREGTTLSYIRFGLNKLQWHPTGNAAVVYDVYHTGNLPTPSTAPTANTLVRRDVNGYVQAVIFKDNYGTHNTAFDGICYRISQADGYHRFCTKDFFKEQLNLMTRSGIQSVADTYALKSPYGQVAILPLNTEYCHFQTDRPKYYFNKPVFVAGDVYGGVGYNRRLAYADELTAHTSSRNNPHRVTAGQIGAYKEYAGSIQSADIDIFTNRPSGGYIVQYGGQSGALHVLRSGGSTSAIELFMSNYNFGTRLRLRKTIDSNRYDGGFKELAWLSDLDNYALKNGSLLNDFAVKNLTVAGTAIFRDAVIMSNA